MFEMNCPNCGKANLPRAQTCKYCGRSLRAAALPVKPPEALPLPRQVAKKPNCLGTLVRQVVSFIFSSVSGWVSGLVTAAFVPFLVQTLGSETARQNAEAISLVLAGIPFTISLLIALIGGLIFNRGRRAAV